MRIPLTPFTGYCSYRFCFKLRTYYQLQLAIAELLTESKKQQDKDVKKRKHDNKMKSDKKRDDKEKKPGKKMKGDKKDKENKDDKIREVAKEKKGASKGKHCR